MQQIKLEADIKRKEEEKKKLLKIQQEEEAKKRIKEDQKKKREQQQKEMREDLQKRRQQLQQQSQPDLESEPKYIVRQTISQPENLDDILEEYNSEEETYEAEGQSSNKKQFQDAELEDQDEPNMDYGLVQQENDAEMDALQQAILCKEYEKVLEEVQETNNIVNQLQDPQFEKKRQQILEQFDLGDGLDFDDLEDDDDEDDLNLTKTAKTTNQDVGLDYFNNPQGLRLYLQQVLSKEAFEKIYNYTLNDLLTYQVEEIEKMISNNKSLLQILYLQISIQYITHEETKKFIPLMLQLVVQENSQ